MKKQLLLFVLTLLPLVANADDSGKCGENVYYSFDEATHTLTISGEGLMDSYYAYGEPDNRPWRTFLKDIHSVIIESGVTSIDLYAFGKCSNLKSVTIPSSVITIEGYAFCDCSSLTSVTIPNSVTSIGSFSATGGYVFSGCSSLSSITIPNSVTGICRNAFEDCSSLTSITISNSVTRLGDDVFSGCSRLTSITIPSSVTKIGKGVFSGCSSLTSIKVEDGNMYYDSRNNCNAIIDSNNQLIAGCKNTIIPNSVTSIGNYAFRGCSGLLEINLPNSLRSIGDYAFQDCNNLGGIVSEIENPFYINNTVFEGIPSHSRLIVPYETTVAYQSTAGWSDFSNIMEVQGNGKTFVYGGIYYYVKDENSVGISANEKLPTSYHGDIVIPSQVTYRGKTYNVTTIGGMAFQDCNWITSVVIPNSIIGIGNQAFSLCSRLTTVVSEIENPFDIPLSVFGGIGNGNALLIVPSGTKAAYEAIEGWGVFQNIVEIADEVKANLADGFYHLKNAVTGRYISINDTDPSNYQTTQAGDINMGGIRTYINYDSVAVSPSCVFYIKNLGEGKYDLICQGSSFRNMINQEAIIYITSNNNGTYKIHETAQGITKYLSDGSPSESDSWMMNRLTETQNWIPIPITTTDEYIAVRPDVKTADGQYFGTIYAGFNFRLASEGMAAYYISNAEGTSFTMNRIEGNVIPAGTPVVVKCKSANIEDNKIEPVVGDYTFDYQNCLGGVYCSISVSKHRNTTLYDQSTMRLLGLDDNGVLAFVKDIPAERLYKDQYLMANKAFLKVNSSDAGVMRLSGYDQVMPKCATPIIKYENGKITFSCETEDVEFVSCISAPDAKNYSDSDLALSYKYIVSVYATKNGYENSDTATREIIITGNGKAVLVGDVNQDGVVNVADHVKLSNIIMDKE